MRVNPSGWVVSGVLSTQDIGGTDTAIIPLQEGEDASETNVDLPISGFTPLSAFHHSLIVSVDSVASSCFLPPDDGID